MSTNQAAEEAPTSEQTSVRETKEDETAVRPTEHTSEARETSTGETKPTYTDMASTAATQAATTAAGVKDSVFSMFGGGAKKEKKDEPEEPEDKSGSAKAHKEAEAEDEVGAVQNGQRPAAVRTDLAF